MCLACAERHVGRTARRFALQLGRAALAAALLVAPAYAQKGAGDVVYVPTPQAVVDAMLHMAKVGPADMLFDLGSGDGRIVVTAAKTFGARALGVELDRYLLGVASESARRAGVADRARFVEQDLFQTDITSATVITTYLLPEMNLKLRPKILALPAGTRVVAHDYHFGDWLPDESATLEVPEKQVGTPGVSYVYLWRVPATASGQWRSELTLRSARLEIEIRVAQRFQMLSGSVKVGAATVPIRNAQLVGDRVSFDCETTLAGVSTRLEFRGRVSGAAIEGTASVRDHKGSATLPWNAALVASAAREDQATAR